jgi:hypothetical protein
MDTPPAIIPKVAVPDDGKGEEPKKSLGDLRKQLETGQPPTPPTGEERMTENRNQPLANPKIQTPNIGNTQPE